MTKKEAKQMIKFYNRALRKNNKKLPTIIKKAYRRLK
jgi:hypothetical protein